MKLRKYKYIEEGNENVHDTEYLELLMEVQEEIQAAESKDQLVLIKNKIVDKLKDIKFKIEVSFEGNRLDEVYEMLKLMKFYLSLLNMAEKKDL